MAAQEEEECLTEDDKTKHVEEAKEEQLMVVSGRGDVDEI